MQAMDGAASKDPIVISQWTAAEQALASAKQTLEAFAQADVQQRTTALAAVSSAEKRKAEMLALTRAKQTGTRDLIKAYNGNQINTDIFLSRLTEMLCSTVPHELASRLSAERKQFFEVSTYCVHCIGILAAYSIVETGATTFHVGVSLCGAHLDFFPPADYDPRVCCR